MSDQEGTSAAPPELLMPGIYPVWSPYDSYEAAEALMKVFMAEQDEQSKDAVFRNATG